MPPEAPHPPRPDKLVILGKSGSGKSSLTKALIRSIPRVVIFDPKGEYAAPHVIRGATPKDLYRYIDGRKRFCVSYKPESERARRALEARSPEKNRGKRMSLIEREFDQVSWGVFVVGSLTFVAEELDQCCTSAWAGPKFGKLLRQGRTRGVEMICISRRPTEIPKDVTANMTQMVIFNSSEPGDMDYFRRRLGPAVDRIPDLQTFGVNGATVSTGIEWREGGALQLVDVNPPKKTFRFRPLGSHQEASAAARA